MYDVLDVCRHVINYSNDKEYGISNLKLQKVLYFIQAYYLVLTSQKCFNDRIEAWDLGPVVPKAYREYKQFGASNIPKIHYIINFDDNNIWNSRITAYDIDLLRIEDQKLTDTVVDRLADYSASDLVNITHNQSPWKDAYVPHMNREITADAIKEYFNA